MTVEVQRSETATGARRTVSYDVPKACTACRGRGVVDSADPASADCARCSGTGETIVSRRIDVRIPPGIDDGTQLRVAGEGGFGGPGAVSGDLFLDVLVLEEPRGSRLIRYAALVLFVAAVAVLVLYVLGSLSSWRS